MFRLTAGAIRFSLPARLRCCASKAGDNPAAMKLLIEHHALVDLPNADGVTPLMAAAGMGHGINPSRGRYQGDDDAALAVGMLLDAGADIHRRASIR